MKPEDIKGEYKYVPKMKEQQMKDKKPDEKIEERINVNEPERARKDIAKAKMDIATTKLKERINEIKQIERKTGQPLSSTKILGYMADIEKEFLATKIYNQLQSILREIEEKLKAYDAPINAAKAQIRLLTKNQDDFKDTVQIAVKSVKAVAWIIGTLVTVFTLANFLMKLSG